ncbi:MAG: hypothetical protein RLZ98_3416 [Pseudomonadota bacterium]|jgi:O-antigen ligase
MSAPVATWTGSDAGRSKSAVHRLMLATVWLAVASGAVVFSEPAPVDALTMALIVGLPAAGLVVLNSAICVTFAFWLIAAAAAFISSSQAYEFDVATKHSAISLYLYLAFFVFAGFVAARPKAHTDLIFRAYTAGALIASIAGIIGYFGLLPGAAELFTKYGRAAGPFKDPNVFGPFVIPAILYTFHRMFSEGRRGPWQVVLLAIMLFAVLISFSRGAWANLFIAVTIYGAMTFVVSQTNWQRVGLIVLATGGLATMALLVAVALQFDNIAKLMNERAQLTQSYDVGPNGRFGGQEKALGLIAEHPLGIGALEFAGRHHHEEVHNVYLSMYLNAGWLGGTVYLALMVLTCLYGLRRAFRRSPVQPLLIVAVAAFMGNVLEGLIVDVDHWRHLYLLMAIVWGLAATTHSLARVPRRPVRIVAPARRASALIAARRLRRPKRPARLVAGPA